MSVTTEPKEGVDLNVVVVVGEVTSPLVVRTLNNGDIASSFDITMLTTEGRVSVPIALVGESDLVIVGAHVCVVGIVRRRFFRAGAGVTSRTEVLAEKVTRVKRKAQVRKYLERAIEDISLVLES